MDGVGACEIGFIVPPIGLTEEIFDSCRRSEGVAGVTVRGLSQSGKSSVMMVSENLRKIENVGAARCVTGVYMAALVAARHNPILRNFYLRLRTGGRPAKVALTATMRKLLIVLNSTLKSEFSLNL